MPSAILHKELAGGKWFTLSLAEQLGNIGSEVSRAKREEGKDKCLFEAAVDRALELFDFTLADPRWRGRIMEIARAREVFCDTVFNGSTSSPQDGSTSSPQGEGAYKSTLEDLDRYFLQFATFARRNY